MCSSKHSTVTEKGLLFSPLVIKITSIINDIISNNFIEVIFSLGVVHILYQHARGGGGVREMLMISYVGGGGVDQMLM